MSSLRATKHVPKGVHHGHREPEEIEEARKERQQLPHSITPAMIARAQKTMERNKAKIDDGDTFRVHQSSKRSSPSKTHNGLYA